MIIDKNIEYATPINSYKLISIGKEDNNTASNITCPFAAIKLFLDKFKIIGIGPHIEINNCAKAKTYTSWITGKYSFPKKEITTSWAKITINNKTIIPEDDPRKTVLL